MKRLYVLWLVSVGLAMPFAGIGASQTTFLNLDLETATRGQVWGWSNSTAGYEYAADVTTAVSGNQSLRLRNIGASAPAFAATGQTLPLSVVAGHHIHLAGFIQTSGMTRGFAGFWMRVDQPDGTVSAFNNMSSLGISGSTAWTQYSFDLDVAPDAADVVFGALQTGDGTAWFDNITLDIDGMRFVDGPAPYVGDPTAAQLNWLQQNVNPFFSPNPAGDLGDLWPVSNIVGNAHIVGLGEGTHGTGEFFQMKHRLLEYLAQKQGFTIFAMEANMPESDAVNQYVLTGQGDPEKLLQGLYFWTWNTQEVLDMIQWIRQYNASGNGPIVFAGFDMQYCAVAIANVQNFIEQAEPDYLPGVESAYAQALAISQSWTKGVSQSTAIVQPVVDAVQAIAAHLAGNRSSYLANFNAYDVDWAIQNAVIVQQATYNTIAGSAYRDQAMASNVEWLVQEYPGARLVLWAHDGHIWKDPGAMGSYIAANHGNDYVAFGQIFHAGRYNAVGATTGGLRAWPATPSFAGTVEWMFHSLGLPWFILDLRQASATDPDSAWLLGPVQYRMIGAVQEDGFFVSNRLLDDFDVLVFFDQTTPSHLLPFN